MEYEMVEGEALERHTNNPSLTEHAPTVVPASQRYARRAIHIPEEEALHG